MRSYLNQNKLKEFMQKFAGNVQSSGKLYLCGGASALIFGIREQTIDIDIKLEPEPRGAFEAILKLKDELNLNIELASPGDFIPAGINWAINSEHIETIGLVEFYHYDLALQALAKLERGHKQDLLDVQAFLSKKLISKEEIYNKYHEIEKDLIRYPAINAARFAQKIKKFFEEYEK